MLINRIGDFFIIIALCFILYIFNSLDYDIVFSLATYVIQINMLNTLTYLDVITLFLFLGAMGKSAQLGLHT
jgi:NADH:ubiquinone oxidoreductase subunit 5 (subunit L)/multisubunit Na+/H+ antiporter MnhA subunit